jgi:putative membrane protein
MNADSQVRCRTQRSTTRAAVARGRVPAFLAALGAIVFASSAHVGATSADTPFAKKAAMGGMGEVVLARIAMQNGSSPSIKAFAQRMITDHGQANLELMSLAKREGIALPTSIDPPSAMMQKKLASLHGSTFDRAYLQGQESAHVATENLLKNEISSGSDPALVSFAKATLPTVEAHLRLDKSDIAKMGAMSGGSSM